MGRYEYVVEGTVFDLGSDFYIRNLKDCRDFVLRGLAKGTKLKVIAGDVCVVRFELLKNSSFRVIDDVNKLGWEYREYTSEMLKVIWRYRKYLNNSIYFEAISGRELESAGVANA